MRKICYANYRTKGRVTGYCACWHAGTVVRTDTCTIHRSSDFLGLED